MSCGSNGRFGSQEVEKAENHEKFGKGWLNFVKNDKFCQK
jgi:hypothetical protein